MQRIYDRSDDRGLKRLVDAIKPFFSRYSPEVATLSALSLVASCLPEDRCPLDVQQITLTRILQQVPDSDRKRFLATLRLQAHRRCRAMIDEAACVKTSKVCVPCTE
jgi:hypothetical protein